MGEWIEEVELACDPCGVKSFKCVVPFQLTKRTFSVYQQLTKEAKFYSVPIKDALCTVFFSGRGGVADCFLAYKQFEAYNLCPDETRLLFGRF